MYRLQKMCEEVSNGNYNPVTSLRKADQLTALAQSFASMIDALREKQDNNKSKVAELRKLLESMLKQVEKESDKKFINDMFDKLDEIS